MSFLTSLTKLATTVGGAMTGGAVPAIFEIGKDVLNLIDEAKTVVHTNDAPALQAIRDELEPKVLAHADKTATDLRGG